MQEIATPSLWENNEIQFARLIQEAEMAGAFTEEVLSSMLLSMDLEMSELGEIFERATSVYDTSVSSLPTNQTLPTEE